MTFIDRTNPAVLKSAALAALLLSAPLAARVCDYNDGDLYTGCDITINIPYCDSYDASGCTSYTYYTANTPGPDGESSYLVNQGSDNTLTIGEYLAKRGGGGGGGGGGHGGGVGGTGPGTHQPWESPLRTGSTYSRHIPDDVEGTDRWGVWATDGHGLTVSVVFNAPAFYPHPSWQLDDWEVITKAEPESSVPEAHEVFGLTWSGRLYVRHENEDGLRITAPGKVELSLSEEDGATMLGVESSFIPYYDHLGEAYSASSIPVTDEGFEGSGVSGHFYGDDHRIAAGTIVPSMGEGRGLFAATRNAREH